MQCKYRHKHWAMHKVPSTPAHLRSSTDSSCSVASAANCFISLTMSWYLRERVIMCHHCAASEQGRWAGPGAPDIQGCPIAAGRHEPVPFQVVLQSGFHAPCFVAELLERARALDR